MIVVCSIIFVILFSFYNIMYRLVNDKRKEKTSDENILIPSILCFSISMSIYLTVPKESVLKRESKRKTKKNTRKTKKS